MAERYETSAEASKEDTLVYSGLLGLCVVGLFTILTLSALDIPLKISLYSFAVGIPLLAMSVCALVWESRYKWTAIPFYIDVANFGGPIISLIGLATIFWHFSWIIGVVFIVASGTATIFMWKFTSLLEKLNEKKDT